MSVTAQDIAIINQTNHVVKYKLELLDMYLQVTDELTSDTSDVSFEIDATSDIRRTATLTMVITNESWLTDNFEIGWIDKLVRFSIGLLYQGEWHWYALGTLLLTSDAFRYDASTRELSMSLVDMMACGTSERGSQIGTGVKYLYDSNIKQALDSTISRWLPFKETDIAEFPDVLPYDLVFGVGTYPYDILRTIIALFPWYEQYYDVNGLYHAQQLPMNVDEPCLLTHEDIDDLIIAEQKSFDFSNIKNTTEIYGKSISANYVASSCTLSGDTYTLGFVLSDMEVLENNKKYAFTPLQNSPASPKIHIALTDPQSQDTAVLLGTNGEELEAGALRANYAYVVRCLDVPEEIDGETILVKKFYLMGQSEIHVIVREMNAMPDAETIETDKNENDCPDIKYVINADSPYACDRPSAQSASPYLTIKKGEIRQVLYDGDYAGIYSTQLAYERGAYENYLKCRMNTDVELTTVLIPFIDVNKKIEYTSPITHEVHQYIVKSVNMDVGAFTMTMKLARFYNYYPTVFQIVTQPVSVEGEVGETVQFNVTAVGDEPTYQWQYSSDQVSWSNSHLLGYDTDTLSVTIAAAHYQYYWRCVVRDGNGARLISDSVQIIEPT